MNYSNFNLKVIKAQKGWKASEMETWSDDKKRQVLAQYGQSGLTPNTYAWLFKRVGSSLATSKERKTITNASILKHTGDDKNRFSKLSNAETAAYNITEKNYAIRNYEAKTGKKYDPSKIDDTFLMLHFSRNVVKDLQKKLGFTGNDVDGIYGPNTRNAETDYNLKTLPSSYFPDKKNLGQSFIQKTNNNSNKPDHTLLIQNSSNFGKSVFDANKKVLDFSAGLDARIKAEKQKILETVDPAQDLGMTVEDFNAAPIEEIRQRVAGFEAMKNGGGEDSNKWQRAGYYFFNTSPLFNTVYRHFKDGENWGTAATQAYTSYFLQPITAISDLVHTVEDPSYKREEYVPLKTAVGQNGQVYFTGESDYRNSSINNPARGWAFNLENVGGAAVDNKTRLISGTKDYLQGNVEGNYNYVFHPSNRTGQFNDSNHDLKLGRQEGNYVKASLFPGTGYLYYADPTALETALNAGIIHSSLPIMQFETKAKGLNLRFSNNYYDYLMGKTNSKGVATPGISGYFSGINYNGGDELTGNSMRVSPDGTAVFSDKYDFGKSPSSIQWMNGRDLGYAYADYLSGNGIQMLDTRKVSHSGSAPTDDDILSLWNDVNVSGLTDDEARAKFTEVAESIWGPGKNSLTAVEKVMNKRNNYNNYRNSATKEEKPENTVHKNGGSINYSKFF